MAENMQQPGSFRTIKPITLIPVGLKEAALDSPTFRSGFTHFSEQLELVEKWLEGYARCITKLSHEVATFEPLVNGFLTQTTPPSHISEAVLDHDYTLLAMKRYGEGAKEYWSASVSGFKKMEANMVEPIKAFLQNELRSFKDTRRNLDQSQKQLDHLLSRYSAQAKTKEASSLREDAFQLHEARKAYLKASMDFGVMAPQLRMALDKMLVKVFSDQWRAMREPRQNISSSISKWGSDIDRVKGWSIEMENSEKAFRRELQNARKQIEESAEAAVRPSRELEDYAVGSASVAAARGPSTANLQAPGGKPRPPRPEKQGWLNLRTMTGKPSRIQWLRRWFFIKNGIFGWLVQGSRSGGVEESERIGVLLCNVRPASSEDRRYVFEVKTKDTTIVLQAETQPEMNEWLGAFDFAKQKALEDPASTESPGVTPRAQDAAFAISPPSAPEFAASAADSGMPQHADENSSNSSFDRSSTLPVPGGDAAVNRSSFDVSSHRRATATEKDRDSSRDPASRIIQKLDLHRKSIGGSSPSSPGLAGGGIASLIAASHTSMPVGPGALPPPPPPPETPRFRKALAMNSMRELPISSLAPNTLANPPAPTNLSAAAVIVNGERGIGMGRTDASGGMPSGVMANVWGSSSWGFLNRLERGESRIPSLLKLSNPPSPRSRPAGSGDVSVVGSVSSSFGNEGPPSSAHRKTVSLDLDKNDPAIAPPIAIASLEYPNYYPLQLKTQDAQFRLLFPDVRPDEKVVLVFKATWNPNEQQDFPGRVYVTAKEIYFYSNHCGMTMTTSIRLDSISDATAANGRECDYVFLHMKSDSPSGYTRITIKTFLEPLRLLQRRLNFLVRNSSGNSVGIEEIMKTLIRQEDDDLSNTPSVDSCENLSVNTPVDGGSSTPRREISQKDHRDLRANLLVDRGLYGDINQLDSGTDQKSFKLPKQPVIYTPQGMDELTVEREFDISPKALFHVMFGDKSAVFQLLYHERQGQKIKQGPWTLLDLGHLRREFEYIIEYLSILRQTRQTKVEDHQMVDVANEHLLYVISNRKTPWHLPYRKDFTLLSKIVITHLAKSKCKLAIYVRVDWTKSPPLMKGMIDRAALDDMKCDSLDLADVLVDQVRRLPPHDRTKKAVAVFGHVGVQTQVSEFAGGDSPLNARLRRSMTHRTLTRLVLESCLSILESAATSLMQILIGFARWTWKTVNAQNLILTILLFSLIANLLLSSKSTSDWWSERKAHRFMAKLGVGPDLTMSKAIYIQDLEEATALEIGYPNDEEEPISRCRQTFNDIINTISMDLPYQPASLSSPKPSRTATAVRLQRTRQNLASQRHGLLVAMRVVNSIEREMLQAEWEDWLLEENAKCKQVGLMLRDSSTENATRPSGTMRGQSGVHRSRWMEYHNLQRDYCESCRKEREKIEI